MEEERINQIYLLTKSIIYLKNIMMRKKKKSLKEGKVQMKLVENRFTLTIIVKKRRMQIIKILNR